MPAGFPETLVSWVSSDVSIWYQRRWFGRELRPLRQIAQPNLFAIQIEAHQARAGHSTTARQSYRSRPVRISQPARSSSPRALHRAKAVVPPRRFQPAHSSPRTAARTLCSCTVPVTCGKEKPEELPEMFPAHDPAICSFISAAPSTLAFTAGRPNRLAKRKVRDTSPSPTDHQAITRARHPAQRLRWQGTSERDRERAERDVQFVGSRQTINVQQAS